MTAPGFAALEQVRTELVPALLAAFPDSVSELTGNAAHDPTPEVLVRADQLKPVVNWLRARGLNALLDLAGVDYLGYPGRTRENRFEVVYHLFSFSTLGRIRLRVQLGEQNPEVETLSDLWPAADPAEREVFDMYGVKFKGHPNLTRILNPDDFDGHPLRKDFPLRGARALVPLLDADENWFHPIKDGSQDPSDGK